MNENYAHPGDARGRRRGIIKGMYLLKAAARQGAARVQLLGSGHDPARGDRRRRAAARRLRASPPTSGAPRASTSCAATADAERWNLLHPDGARRASYVETCLEGHAGPVIAATDYMRNYADQIRQHVAQAPLRRARHRRLRAQRLPRQAAPLLRGRPLLRRVAALKALADDGEIEPDVVPRPSRNTGSTPSVPIPWTV